MSWTTKVIKDYIYKIGESSFTGYKGAINFGTRLEQQGVSDEDIQKIISRSMTKTVDIKTQYIKLIELSEFNKIK